MMTPKEIVHALDIHIIGQNNAKKAVAIALRNRWRRSQLPEELRPEVTPKNILMIGPTGVGKTEIARRLAKLTNAPFIKVEATKYTEVGYVGREVDSIIKDLTDMSMKMYQEEFISKVQNQAADKAENRILDALLPSASKIDDNQKEAMQETRTKFRKMLRDGKLDDKEIDIDLEQNPTNVEIMGPSGMEEMTDQLQSMFSNFGDGKKQAKRMTVKNALAQVLLEESKKLIDRDEVKARAIDNVEQNGIVFIDEIDKVAKRQEASGGDVSREGVQRDLLPLIEGCSVKTKHGMVNTDHILFIASGAFHLSKPSDLIPELQGRLPIRVELQSLKVKDFVQILTQPKAALTKQAIALLATEDVNIEFTDDAIQRLAEIAYQVNDNTENIGARRLHTVLEHLLEEISFDASENSGKTYVINAEFVDKRLNDLVKDEDLSQFIL